jgi:DNA modification methylase
MRLELVPLDQLATWPGNPKAHDLDGLGESFDRFGFVEPVVFDEGTQRLVAGHGRRERLMAMKSQGLPPPGRVELAGNGDWLVPVLRGVSFADAREAEAYLLASNRLVEAGGWDSAELIAMLASHTEDLSGIGWSADEVAKLVADVGRASAIGTVVAEDEAVVQLPKTPVTKSGDVWVLGRHRLICGDCRDQSVVQRVVTAPVNVAFTSPPYASQRKYDESSGFEPIHPDKYVAWFEAVQSNVRTVLASDGSFFVNIKPSVNGLDTSLYVFDLVSAHVRKWGWHFATEYCWERIGVPKWVEQRFKNQFEPIYQFVTERWKMRPEAVRHESQNVPGRGGACAADMQGTGESLSDNSAPGLAYPGNRLPAFAPGPSLGHAAAFPVGLPAFFIRAYTDPSDHVFDPFIGSGTTLIAAEQLDRVCFGTEISPAYCDVIVERWQNLTGQKAQRAGSTGPRRRTRRTGTPMV